MPSTAISHALLITGARSWEDGDQERAMAQAFYGIWQNWDPRQVTSPALISGHCPGGADAMAERLWLAAGCPPASILAFKALWETHGKAAGFRRNTEMAEAAHDMQTSGVQVRCAAFLDICRKPNCSQAGQHQLMPGFPGHFSHGTIHARHEMRRLHLPVTDVISPALPPF